MCRFKTNYLDVYSENKYYLCLIAFLIVVGIAIGLCVFVYELDEQFKENLIYNNKRLLQVNTLARDVSLLETKWMAVYQLKDQNELAKAKTQYL